MTVHVVYTEWNRPHDCDGGCTLEKVCATKVLADQVVLTTIDYYKELGDHLPYWDPRTEEETEDWDFDVHVEEREVIT